MEEALNATEEWMPANFDTGLTADDWKEILEDQYKISISRTTNR